jgi:hypothetical protein
MRIVHNGVHVGPRSYFVFEHLRKTNASLKHHAEQFPSKPDTTRLFVDTKMTVGVRVIVSAADICGGEMLDKAGSQSTYKKQSRRSVAIANLVASATPPPRTVSELLVNLTSGPNKLGTGAGSSAIDDAIINYFFFLLSFQQVQDFGQRQLQIANAV